MLPEAMAFSTSSGSENAVSIKTAVLVSVLSVAATSVPRPSGSSISSTATS